MAKKKAKIPRTVPKLFKQPPFFKSGLLRYRSGDHAITLSNGYYRCVLNCKDQCKVHTAQIPKETLERAFCRYTRTYAISLDIAEKINRRLFRENLVDVLMGIEDEYSVEERLFEATLDAALQEPDVKETDLKTAADALAKMSQAEYPAILMAYVMGTLVAVAHPEAEAELGKLIAFLSKHITLSDDGKLSTIEFERWGWYCINVINKSVPGYITKIRTQKITVVNQKDNLTDLPLAKAALEFGLGNTKGAMGANMNMMYGVVTWMKSAMSLTFDIKDPKIAAQASLAFLQEMRNDPALQMIAKFTNTLDLKINKLPKSNA
jgi:hypothetical protein